MVLFSAVCVQCRKKLDEPVTIAPTAAEDETQNVTEDSALEEQSSISFEATKAVLVRIVTMAIAKKTSELSIILGENFLYPNQILIT